MKTKVFALLMTAVMLLTLCVGCGGDAVSETASSAPAEASETASEVAEATTEEVTEVPVEEASTVEEAPVEEGPADFTESNANNDFSGYKEMLTTLTTALPVVEEPVTLSYFLGYETAGLNYIEGGTLDDHQVWQWLEENTGVDIELKVVDKTTESDKFNLMIASGEYTDMFSIANYTAGAEAAYEEEVIIDLTDYIEENMPNYWTILNSDAKIFEEAQDAGMNLTIYPIKDEVANPSGIGPFIRMDWLEDLDMEVPTTYDELTEVLRAFKTEKGATEPMSLFATVSMQNGLLSGGFGSLAELSADSMGTNYASSFYQVDGEVVYGAIQDGTRKYLSWLNELYNEDLINFENMQNREANPFSDLNAGAAANGSTGYIFSNQPFGGNYSSMAASQYGDENCNWWPVQDVAEESGATIPFFEESTLVDSSAAQISISSQCDDVEAALAFLDYGYSYEGALLYNFGFQKGSGEGSFETWDFVDGKPTFDADVLLSVADTTNIASGVVSTKDLAGIVIETRLAFEFGERELSCFSAWATNKNTSNNLGSDVTLTADEGTNASAIYSDIITYVGTSALQFINGDLDINDNAVWDSYVSTVESMNIAELTEIIQGAYDRVNG